MKKQAPDRTNEVKVISKSLEFEIAKRTQAEKALASSESKYRGLVENSLLGIFSTNLAGQFSFVNDAMVRIFDFDSAEQMLAINSHSLWANPGHREQMLSLLNENGRVDNFEAETITRTGRYIHVLFSATLNDGNITCMGMDITRRKQAEEKLRVSEIKYRTLLENLPQKIFLKDRCSTYLSCNRNFARDLKIMPEEIAVKTDDDFFPRELADKYRGDDKRVLESG